MVAIEHNHRRLSPLFHSLHQISGKLIHLIDLIDVILPFILRSLIRNPFHQNFRILDNPLFRVVSMSLDADSEHKILPFCSVHRLQNMLNQDIILGPSIFCCLQDIHKFLAGITVKSHIIEHLRPAVEIPPIIVERMGSVPQGRKRRRRALTHLILEHRLIRILPRPEIPEVHTRQNLELRICSSRPNGRNLKITGRKILIHMSEVRACIL